MGSRSTTQPAPARGRPAATSRHRLETAALELFALNGFDRTTVDDIAAAAGVGRRTFFRYFASKNDAAWGDFDELLVAWEEDLRRLPPDAPVLDAVRDAVLRFNEVGPDAVDGHRRRMRLLLGVPALQAHSAVRYSAWRAVLARFVAARLGAPVDSLVPQLVGRVALGVALAAYEQWLRDDAAALPDLLGAALQRVDVDLVAPTGAAG